jgi:phage terminase large subunit GpA-like protein
MVKGELFSWLKLARPLPNENYPPGFCHFPEYYTETYFQGLTSEAMKEEVFRGERRIVFKKNTDVRNEPLDARTYARAAAALYGLDRFSEKHWKKMRQELGLLAPDQKEEDDIQNHITNKKTNKKIVGSMI